ncbi:Tim44 domain-containing protein [Nitrospira sp. NS4]|uniref:Tim44 domain-containing protein n=1 Tax=Nitrospira sp. NS4 TaxID=3414498 RepID=UPI003C2F5F3C
MLLGATSVPAAVNDDGSGNSVKEENGAVSTSSGPSTGVLLFMMASVWLGAYYLYKRRNPHLSPAFSGPSNARAGLPAWVPPSIGVLSPVSSSDLKLTAADEAEFRRLLIEIQAAWDRQDAQRLRRLTTPEMYQYFSDKLAKNVSRGVESRVEDVVVMRTEVCESWAEEARFYATVLMQWTARDYVRPLAMPSSELGDAGEAGDRLSGEFAEAWTFVKHHDGKWVLSAIQRVANLV